MSRRYHGTHDVEKAAGVEEPKRLETGEAAITEPEQAKTGGRGRRKAASAPAPKVDDDKSGEHTAE